MINMDCYSDLSKGKDEETSGQSFFQGKDSIKLGDRFRIDGAKSSCADYHPKVLNNLGNMPQKSKDLQQKQQILWKADEVVRYMSNLPTYLERGEKKDKTFHVGVLEWRRLEKWQYKQQLIPTQSCRSSPSSSNTSSFSSTEGTSSYSSRGQSCSPARQRPHHGFLDSNLNASSSKMCPRTPKPSDRNGHSCSLVHQRSHHIVLDASLNASPSKVYSRATTISERNGLKHKPVDIPSDYLKLQQSILMTHQSFNKYTEIKPKKCKKNLALLPTSNEGKLRQGENQFSASGLKGRLKVQDGEVLEEKEKESLQGLSTDHSDPRRIDGQQKLVVLLPKDGKDITYPACPEKSASLGKYEQEEIETSQRSSIDEPILKFDEGSSVLSCSCPHTGEVDALSLQLSPVRSKGIKFPSEVSQSIPYSARLSFSPVKSKELVEKMSIEKLNSSSEVPKVRTKIEESSSNVNGLSSCVAGSSSFSCETDAICQPQNQTEQPSSTNATCLKFPPEVSQSTLYPGRSPVTVIRDKKLEVKNSPKKLKSSVVEDCRVRHPSPVRRFSFSMGKMGRNSSANNSYMQSVHPAGEVRSGGAEASVLSTDSSCEKSNATGKGRSSPLRRLLDPLLKPRAGNLAADFRRRDSAQMDKSTKFSGGHGEASTLHSVKVKLDLGSCKSINIDHPRDLGKCGSTMVQALLQVAVKNGLPLFTFAVDNSSDILAATMKKLTSGRNDGNNLIYTFFAVHEIKKKNGNWLSQGSKDKNHDYISDIVGQMKVSDVPNSLLTKQNSVDQCSTREFVLLAPNARQTNQQVPDFQINDELAAIVVKLPNGTAKLLCDSGSKQGYSRKVSGNLIESHLEGCVHFDCGDAEVCGSSSGNTDSLGLTVILPGGDHGVPSEGKASPLIQRWRLGGLCDCGGWDVGCQLRVFASEAQLNRGTVSNKSQPTAKKFQLYSQQDQLSDRKPIFSLSPFKDGIYSIEFESSLKLLQAFSICIAILNGLKPAEFSELTHFFERKSAEETTLPTIDGEKVSNRDLEENPACFVACPPGSPVARV